MSNNKYKDRTKIEYDIKITFENFYKEIVDAEKKAGSENYDLRYCESMERELRFHRVVIKKIVNAAVNAFVRLDSRSTVFVWPFARFTDVFKTLAKDYNLLTFHSVLDSAFRHKGYDNAKSLYSIDVDRLIYKGLRLKNIEYTKQAIAILCSYFKSNHVRMIIVGNDWTFFERAIVLAGRSMHIPVVVLQHGLYLKSGLSLIHMGKYADYFWCWSAYTKDCYMELYHMADDFISVIGYPYEVKNKPIENSRRVLFAGTPYSYINHNLMDEYIELIKIIIQACKDLNLHFSLRLHPGEDRAVYANYFENMNEVNISSVTNLEDDVLNSGIVIGDNTSVLLQAICMNRPAIQILWNKEIQQVSKDVAYKSTIKVNYNIDDIKSAINNNIGNYNEVNLKYELGELGVFKENILRETKKILGDSVKCK